MPPPPGEPPGDWSDDEERGRPWWVYALGVVVLGILIGVVIALATSGGDDEPTLDTTTSSSSTSSTTAATAPPPTSPPSTAPAPPAQVTGLHAGPGGGSGEVQLSWNSVAGAVSYNIYRSSSSGADGSFIASVNGTSYVDTPGEPAYYRVSAVSSSGVEGPRSAEECGAPVGDSC
jgi:hypothetical protein